MVSWRDASDADDQEDDQEHVRRVCVAVPDMMAAQEAAGVAPDSNISRFLDVVGAVSGLTVLDAGCGEGYLSRILAQHGANVTGIDISPKLVQMARAKDLDSLISYHVADLSQPLPNYQAHFDLIASYFVLNDVYDYRGFLATMSAALKPAGPMRWLFANQRRHSAGRRDYGQ